MTSSAWVPIDPVLPRISTRRLAFTDSLCRVAAVPAVTGSDRLSCDASVTQFIRRTIRSESLMSVHWAGVAPSPTRETRVTKTDYRKVISAASLAAAAILTVSACSNDDSTSATTAAETTSAAATTTTSQASPTTSAMADPAANLVGPGCAAYAEQVPEGPGSVTGMSQDPVTVAASNNPMLTTLTQALSASSTPT